MKLSELDIEGIIIIEQSKFGDKSFKRLSMKYNYSSGVNLVDLVSYNPEEVKEQIDFYLYTYRHHHAATVFLTYCDYAFEHFNSLKLDKINAYQVIDDKNTLISLKDDTTGRITTSFQAKKTT